MFSESEGERVKKPKIKEIYLNDKLNEDWKYDRKTGTLEFPYNVPLGTKMVIVYHESIWGKIKRMFRRRRGNDGKRVE